jgi:hypothetical protein
MTGELDFFYAQVTAGTLGADKQGQKQKRETRLHFFSAGEQCLLFDTSPGSRV